VSASSYPTLARFHPTLARFQFFASRLPFFRRFRCNTVQRTRPRQVKRSFHVFARFHDFVHRLTFFRRFRCFTGQRTRPLASLAPLACFHPTSPVPRFCPSLSHFQAFPSVTYVLGTLIQILHLAFWYNCVLALHILKKSRCTYQLTVFWVRLFHTCLRGLAYPSTTMLCRLTLNSAFQTYVMTIAWHKYLQAMYYLGTKWDSLNYAISQTDLISIRMALALIKLLTAYF
jgi:hypothetical protein